MKKLFVILAILLTLTGCSPPVIEPTSTPEDSPGLTIKATEKPLPSPSILPLSRAEIQIDENNSITVSTMLTDGTLTGSAFCFFDGTDITTEYENILAAMYIFGELDIQNYTVIGMSGDSKNIEDIVSLIYKDGELNQFSKLPSKYKDLITDNERVMEYVKIILNNLSENTEGQSEPSLAPTPGDTPEPKAEATESSAPLPTPKNTPEPAATEEPSPTATPEIAQPVDSNMTAGQKNALDKAKSYLSFSAFSYQGLIEQLEYEQFSHEDSVYAADNCDADWSEQALKKAKSYLNISAFSYKGLIDQLKYEGFTSEQAAYGADNCSADWNEQAAKKAKSYMDIMSFSRDGLIKQLEYDKFTHEQAIYGVEQNGY